MASLIRREAGNGISTRSNEFFDEQWSVYQKILRNNYMSHRECYDLLHRFLLGYFHEPYALLDLGCGDASFTSRSLLDTPIAAYKGIDLSAAALEIAQTNMAKLPCHQTFCQQDLFELIPELAISEAENFDAILSSFALHHLTWEQKDSVVQRFSQLLKADGAVLLIDVFRDEGETLEHYLKRYLDNVRKHWQRLAPRDYEMIEEHITANDLPESQSSWWALARTHGFRRMECLFKDSLNSTCFLVLFLGNSDKCSKRQFRD